MSHLTQMVGLAVQNFVSAAVGIAVARRAHPRPHPPARGTHRQLLGRPHAHASPASCIPLSFVVRARSSSSQGVIQNLHGFTERHHASRARRRSIPGGPFASQEAIKELGTNGGGSLNANSAHPFENPNAFTNMLQICLLLLHPVRADLHVRPVGRRTRSRAGRCSPPCSSCGSAASPSRRASRRTATRSSRDAGVTQTVTAHQGGGNMEGKEVRFGVGRLRPLRGLDDGNVDRRRQLLPRQHDARRRRGHRSSTSCSARSARAAPAPASTGCWCSRSSSVFIAGLMVGRTPEYLGKKIQAPEMKLVVLYSWSCAARRPCVRRRLGAARDRRRARSSTPDRTGSSEVTYAFTSAANNNGSRVRRAHRQHGLVQHDARHLRCSSAASS